MRQRRLRLEASPGSSTETIDPFTAYGWIGVPEMVGNFHGAGGQPMATTQNDEEDLGFFSEWEEAPVPIVSKDSGTMECI